MRFFMSKNYYKSKKKSHDNSANVFIALSILAFVMVMVVVGQFYILDNNQKSFGVGTSVNGYSLAGMNTENAVEYLSQVFSENAKQFDLTLIHGDKQWNFTQKDFSVNSDIHTVLDMAYSHEDEVGDYSKQVDYLSKLDGKNLNIAFNYLFVGLDEKIDAVIKQIEVKPVNSEITFNPKGKPMFNISSDKSGLKVDKQLLYQMINNQFLKSNKVVVTIPTYEQKAEVTKADNIKNTSKIATFSTNVADSTGNRKHNVKLALSKFDGFVLKNGETVSFNKITGPHDLASGYKTATIILNSRFVDGVGGGICQASTTLYNALIRAGVAINEVHKHTLPVKYVPLALDAMVSEYLSDLKFTNNTGSDIFIHTYFDANSVSVDLYGKPNDEGLTYNTRSETIQVISHTGDVIKVDEKGEYSDKVLFKGEYYRLSYPREGYEAVAYLQTFKDGKLVDEKEIRHEIYKPQNGIVIEGASEVPAGMEAIESNVEIVENSNECINVDIIHGEIPTAFCP